VRQDLIEIIKAHEEITNAIILTHNIDFVFLQLVVLSALRRCGRPTLTVFADAQCAGESFARQAPVLNTLGIRYRVVPVAMEPGFRFHPKALLLSGSNKATLVVGSGNLTFGGWSENAEVWLRFDSERDEMGPFTAFRLYLENVLKRVPLLDAVWDEVSETFDEQTRTWAKGMGSPSGLLGRVGMGRSLLDEMREAAGDGVTERLVVCAPFFDPKAEALDHLARDLGAAKTTVLIQKKYPGLPRSAASSLPQEVQLTPIAFYRSSADGEDRESFVHAKFYGLERTDEAIVFVGSANCSQAALTIAGKAGNAELLAVRKMARSEFSDFFIDEISEVEGPLELPELQTEIEETETTAASLRILAARYENGLLMVGYLASSEVVLTKFWANGLAVPFEIRENRILVVEVTHPPTRIVLEGVREGVPVRSAEAWVDVEPELRSTAIARTFAGTVRILTTSQRWGIGAWKEVFNVFCGHLQYMPSRVSSSGVGRLEGKTKKLAEYTADDVFSNSYGLPYLGSGIKALGDDDRVRSLQQMLLKWFGIAVYDEEAEASEPTPDDEEEEEDDAVDRPERLPILKKAIQPRKPVTDADLRAAKKSIKQMTDAMMSEDFLSRRPPELLAADLKIAAILLRVALRESWISEGDFYDATRSIWSSLFFTTPGKPTQGWLEHRYWEAESPEDFATKMASPELSAALAAWAMAVVSQKTDPSSERVGFALAQVIAVARLPWLWRGGEPEKISQELSLILVNTGNLKPKVWKWTESMWVRLIRRGQAMRALEEALARQTPLSISQKIRQRHISRGELLWQGVSGYCVALSSCDRSELNPVSVLRLQGSKTESKFRPDFLIPLRALLDTDVLPDTTPKKLPV
jgi:hypothetical protein